MKDFLIYFFNQWWGIALTVAFGAALLLILSSLFYKRFFKRFYDIVLSVVGIVVLSPFLIILTVTGALAFNGKPFFIQCRPGKDGKIFKLVKFRTMTDDKNEKGESLSDEKRLTKYGKFLRNTSIDELPELLNILVGDMSFVGPRPQLVKDMVFMDENQMKRHSVRQGLTGLAQVSGRNRISWEQKFEYDLKYIAKITFWGDIKILFKTVFKVFARKDISADGMETAEDFGDYLLRTGKISKEEYDKKITRASGVKSKNEFGWKYYNRAMIPTPAPHQEADLTPVNSGEIWKNREVLLARWTSSFDCDFKTEWWYCILDKPFDVWSLKAKRRYEITKGIKNFEVKRILDFAQYKEEIYRVQIQAFSAYPEKYRPVVDKDKFLSSVDNWDKEIVKVYGAFDRKTGELCGYAYLEDYPSWLSFNVLKTVPACEKLGVNAAIVYKIVSDVQERLEKGGYYICDGERSILHETAFQDYLEKYFGFRKAYCKLNLVYRPKIKFAVKVLYLFKSLVYSRKDSGVFAKIGAILKMEEIIRRQKKTDKKQNV